VPVPEQQFSTYPQFPQVHPQAVDRRPARPPGNTPEFGHIPVDEFARPTEMINSFEDGLSKTPSGCAVGTFDRPDFIGSTASIRPRRTRFSCSDNRVYDRRHNESCDRSH
jgi:hypothetical protein